MRSAVDTLATCIACLLAVGDLVACAASDSRNVDFAWSVQRASAPLWRAFQASAWFQDQWYHFSGLSLSLQTCLDDLWVYQVSERTWRELSDEGARPPPSMGAQNR
jgi:hypothetical protein